MATETIQKTVPVRTNGAPHKRRDLKTQIWHADEELYKKQLEPKGGKEDMWQGGDMSVMGKAIESRVLTSKQLLSQSS